MYMKVYFTPSELPFVAQAMTGRIRRKGQNRSVQGFYIEISSRKMKVFLCLKMKNKTTQKVSEKSLWFCREKGKKRKERWNENGDI